MDKDILNAIADALMGSGSIQTPEAPQKWYVCISDGKGGHNKHETTSLYQAETIVREWLATGWAAWIQDASGHPLVIASKSKEKN